MTDEDPEARWRAMGWKLETCVHCQGTGMVSDYGGLGVDFLGPKECPSCAGRGFYWSKGAVCALWPGGPFC